MLVSLPAASNLTWTPLLTVKVLLGTELAGPDAGRRPSTSELTRKWPALLSTTQANAAPPVTLKAASNWATEPLINTFVAGSPPVQTTSTPADRSIVRLSSALVHTNKGF